MVETFYPLINHKSEFDRPISARGLSAAFEYLGKVIVQLWLDHPVPDIQIFSKNNMMPTINEIKAKIIKCYPMNNIASG